MERFRARFMIALNKTRPIQRGEDPLVRALTPIHLTCGQFQNWLVNEAPRQLKHEELTEFQSLTQSEFDIEMAQTHLQLEQMIGRRQH